MRVALVSPYSYTYPGGVGRHVEALAQELTGLGHEVRLLAPYDPDDRLARVLHRGASPQPAAPARLRDPAGPHVRAADERRRVEPGGPFAESIGVLGRELRNGGYDVVHVHEPNVPVVSLVRHRGGARARGRHLPHLLDERGGDATVRRELHRRPAALLQAERPHRRVRGGRSGRRSASTAAATGSSRTASTCPPRDPSRAPERASSKLLFVGRAEERKGLPVLLRAFEALRGAGVHGAPHGRRPIGRGGRAAAARARGRGDRGPVDDAEKWRLLGEADLLCAPSLGGESFGMVLTEAFASGTPVVASDIAGYRDVVAARHGRRARARRATPSSSARRCATLALRPGAAHADGRGRARARRALRLAERGRARSRRSTRRRSRVPRARPAAWPRAGPAGRRRARRARSARAAQSACRRSSRRTPRPGAGARRARRGACWWPAGAVAGAGLAALALQRHRDPVDRARDRGRHARLGAGRLRADVRLDAAPRGGVARDPARRAARHARPPPRHRARNDDRRADVRDPAGAARRALARADRGEARGPRARPLPDRARHARLADAAEHPRAGRARRRDVRTPSASSRATRTRSWSPRSRPWSSCSRS